MASYKLNHIHVKCPDPRKSAQWYVENLGCKILREDDVNGALFVRMELAGSLIYVTTPRTGEKPAKADSGVRYGLEHFGITTSDLEGDLARLTKKGVKVLMPLTTNPNGSKVAFIEGPDNVRIEFVQPAP